MNHDEQLRITSPETNQGTQLPGVSPGTMQEFHANVEKFLALIQRSARKKIDEYLLAADSTDIFRLQDDGPINGAYNAVLGTVTSVLRSWYDQHGYGLILAVLGPVEPMSPEFEALVHAVHRDISVNGSEAIETILQMPGVYNTFAESYADEVRAYLQANTDGDEEQEHLC